MSWLGGHMVDVADEHECPVPKILASRGPLAPKVGSVWECDCRTQWTVRRCTPPDETSYLKWVIRDRRVLDRRGVLDLLAADLAGNRTGDELSMWRADVLTVLKALEDRHMVRWGEGAVQDRPVP